MSDIERIWKGDPTDTVKIEAWKASYEPGYTPQIISPRDSSGSYTSDPGATVGYKIISEEEQAKEIVLSLRDETKIPLSIVQTLAKTLNIDYKPSVPVGVTDTKRITGDVTFSGRTLTEGSILFNEALTKQIEVPRQIVSPNETIEKNVTISLKSHIMSNAGAIIILIVLAAIAFKHIIKF